MLVEKFTAPVKIQAIELKNEPVAVFFSGGKDAIVVLDLWMKYHTGPKRFVYMYFVDGLEVVENTLKYYERTFKIKIDRVPCHETLALRAQHTDARKKKYTYADVEKAYLAEHEIDWCVNGMKRADSLARRGMFKHLDETCMDMKNKKAYPVLDWSDKHILAYCKARKLPLPITYNHGINRSFWIPSAEYLIWLRGIYPSDYDKITAEFPQFGDAAFKKYRGV